MGRRGGFRKRKRIKGFHRVPVLTADEDAAQKSTTSLPSNSTASALNGPNTSSRMMDNRDRMTAGRLKSARMNGKKNVKCCDIIKHFKNHDRCLIKGTHPTLKQWIESEKLCQFKIVLLDVYPAIWRRILVPYSYNFWDLHVAIQDVMGWSDNHSHRYEIREPQSGIAHILTSEITEEDIWDPGDIIMEESNVYIYEYFNERNNTALYSYHIDDVWEHKVVFEGIYSPTSNSSYPAVVGGKGGCPIEGTGSLWVYKEVMKAVKNPSSYSDYCERFEQLIEAAKSYEHAFDAKLVKFHDPYERWQAKYSDEKTRVDRYEDIMRIFSSDEDSVDDSGSSISSADDRTDNNNSVTSIKHSNSGNSKSSTVHNSGDNKQQLLQHRERFSCPQNCSPIYEFKIVLKRSSPNIWRRIQVPAHFTFWDFHTAIQDAMGWTGRHSHFFEMLNVQGIAHVITVGDDDSVWDMKKVRVPEEHCYIADYFTETNLFANYVYNLRAYWDHRIIFERITATDGSVARYPLCVAGRRACPPDDYGGITRYEKYLKIAKDPNHPAYKKDKDVLALASMIANLQLDSFDPKSVRFNVTRDTWKQRCLDEEDDLDEPPFVNLKLSDAGGKKGGRVDKPDQQRSDAKLENIYQFKVTLPGVKPTVWRRFHIQAKATFWDLYEAIRDCVGWVHSNLHIFEMTNPKTQLADTLVPGHKNQPFYFPKTIRRRPIIEENTKLYAFFTSANKVAWFEFECLDVWRHKVVFEKSLLLPKSKTRYPVCVDGRRACPIGGSGGNIGYNELLTILDDPKHPRYSERVEWMKQTVPSTFDPDSFSVELTNYNMSMQIWEYFQHTGRVVDLVFGKGESAVQRPLRSDLPPSKPFVYQLKVSLEEVTPTVWRRIIIPWDYTFWELHVAIQDSMGWKDIYPHQFEVVHPAKQTLTIISLNGPMWEWGETRVYEDKAKLIDYFWTTNTRARYDYDFGSNWIHYIEVEDIKMVERSLLRPMCMAGEYACPPENCGGPNGYYELLRAIDNVDHPTRHIYLKWLEHQRDSYHPNYFAHTKVIFSDPQERWKKRGTDHQHVAKKT